MAINNNSVVICAVIDPQTGQYAKRVRKECVCLGMHACVCVVARAKSADAKYQRMHVLPNVIKDLWPDSERKG